MRGGRPRKPNPGCGYPEHEGDRYIPNPKGRVNVSLDFVSEDGNTRHRRIHIMKVCTTCMRKWQDKVDGRLGEQMTMDDLLSIGKP